MPIVTRELIAPDDARRLLDGNVGNRPIRRGLIARLASDMAEGRWIEGSSTIALAPDGRLLDGQHRLMALIQSESVLWFWIARGVDPAAYEVTDVGQPRTLADFLHHRGELSSSTLALGVVLLQRWDAHHLIEMSYRCQPAPSIPTLIAYWDLHREELRAALVTSRRALLHRILSPQRALFLSAMLRRVDANDAEAFLTSLVTPPPGETSDHPIYKIRMLILNDRRQVAGHMGLTRLAALVFKAWNYWREGRLAIGSLIWRSTGPTAEDFPLPR